MQLCIMPLSPQGDTIILQREVRHARRITAARMRCVCRDNFVFPVYHERSTQTNDTASSSVLRPTTAELKDERTIQDPKWKNVYLLQASSQDVFFSRPYLSNGRAYDTVVVCLSVCM